MNLNFIFDRFGKSKFKIETSNQDIILTPTDGYDSVLIFLHGLGDSAMGYRDFFDSNYNKPHL